MSRKHKKKTEEKKEHRVLTYVPEHYQKPEHAEFVVWVLNQVHDDAEDCPDARTYFPEWEDLRVEFERINR